MRPTAVIHLLTFAAGAMLLTAGCEEKKKDAEKKSEETASAEADTAETEPPDAPTAPSEGGTGADATGEEVVDREAAIPEPERTALFVLADAVLANAEQNGGLFYDIGVQPGGFVSECRGGEGPMNEDDSVFKKLGFEAPDALVDRTWCFELHGEERKLVGLSVSVGDEGLDNYCLILDLTGPEPTRSDIEEIETSCGPPVGLEDLVEPIEGADAAP